MGKTLAQTWEETPSHGPWLCALCIGNDYRQNNTFHHLPSCIKDARAVYDLVLDKIGTPRASATPHYNLKDKDGMKDALKAFCAQIRRPPRMVIYYFSGHAVQEGDGIFLLPNDASPRNLEELRQQCLSHDEVFRILKEELADRDVPDQGTSLIS